MSVKYHLSVNGPNRELFGVQTENEPYATFVGAAQEAGLDEVLEQLSSGASRQAAAVQTVQAAFPNATTTIRPGTSGQVYGEAPPTWGAPPVPPFQPAAAAPYQPQQQAAAPQRGAGEVKNGACAHGAATYREGTGKTGKPFRAYFCPAQKGDPNQCQPEFLR